MTICVPTPAAFGLKMPLAVIFAPDQTPEPPETGVPLICKLGAVSQMLCGAPVFGFGKGLITVFTVFELEQLFRSVTVTV